jgi:hypothetical protein
VGQELVVAGVQLVKVLRHVGVQASVGRSALVHWAERNGLVPIDDLLEDGVGGMGLMVLRWGNRMS